MTLTCRRLVFVGIVAVMVFVGWCMFKTQIDIVMINNNNIVSKDGSVLTTTTATQTRKSNKKNNVEGDNKRKANKNNKNQQSTFAVKNVGNESLLIDNDEYRFCHQTMTINFHQMYPQYDPNNTNTRSKYPLSLFLQGPGIQNNNATIETTTTTTTTQWIQTMDHNNSSTNKNYYQSIHAYIKNHIAVCQFIETGLSSHPPHALQQLIRCMSYWRTIQQQQQRKLETNTVCNQGTYSFSSSTSEEIIIPVLIWPRYRYIKGLYSESLSYKEYSMKHPQNKIKRPSYHRFAYTYGLIKSLVQEFHLVVTTNTTIGRDVYFALYQQQQRNRREQKRTSRRRRRRQQQVTTRVSYNTDSINNKSYIKEDRIINCNTTYSSYKNHNTIVNPYYIQLKKRPFLIRTYRKQLYQSLNNMMLQQMKVYIRMDSEPQTAFTVHDPTYDIPYYTNRIKERYRLPSSSSEQKRHDQEDHDEQQATASTKPQQYNKIPKIGIVNRKLRSKRTILNVNELVDAIQVLLLQQLQQQQQVQEKEEQKDDSEFGSQQQQQEAYHNNNNNNNPNATVAVAYFEETSFYEQMQFYSIHDIIISPHGAQLIGTSFMPSDGCSAIIEFLPESYYIPWFFGLLAHASNINYYNMYVLSLNTSTTIITTSNNTNNTTITNDPNRGRARGVNLCPNISSIVDSIQIMIYEWQECKHKQQQ